MTTITSSNFNYNQNTSEASAALTNLKISSNLTVSGETNLDSMQYGAETISAAGAADPKIPITFIIGLAGAGYTITLANGTAVGQQKQFIYTRAFGATTRTVTLTPTLTLGAYSNVLFVDTTGNQNAGQCVTLVWTNLGWAIVSRAGGTGTTQAQNQVNGYPQLS